MSRLLQLLGCSAVLLAVPLTADPPEAAPSAPPYHLAAASDHGRLAPAGHASREKDHRGRHDRRWSESQQDQRRSWHDPHRHEGICQPGLRHWPWLGVPHRLPPRVVEQKLCRQLFQPIGRIEFRHGVYLVPALDPLGRRVLLAIDPATGGILGRRRGD